MSGKKDKLYESLDALFKSPKSDQKLDSTIRAEEVGGQETQDIGRDQSAEDLEALEAALREQEEAAQKVRQSEAVEAEPFETTSTTSEFPEPEPDKEPVSSSEAYSGAPEDGVNPPAQEQENYAGEHQEETGFDQEERVVVFKLGKEAFGIDIYSIRTLVKPQEIYPVPHMPDYLVGLTNLRGEIVPVIDLRNRLGLPQKSYSDSTRFVVAEKREEPICLIVDDVSGIEHFAPQNLEEPSSVISSVDTTYLFAIAKSNDQLVLLLDLDQVLGERILEIAG